MECGSWGVVRGVRNVKCEMWSGKRELRGVERGVRSVDCAVWAVECEVWGVE